MLSCMEKVRMGIMKPSTFQCAEVSRRTVNIDLSHVGILEPVFMSSVLCLDKDPTGRYLLSGTAHGIWYIHDTFNLAKKVEHTKQCALSCEASFHAHGITTVEWYPVDPGLFTTSSSDGSLYVWDSDNTDGAVERYNFKSRVNRHQFNPANPRTIAVCCDDKINFIDIRAGTHIQKLPETGTKGVDLRWNPRDDHTLVVGTDEGHLIEWDVRSTSAYRSFGLEKISVARRSIRTRDFVESKNLLSQVHQGKVKSIRYSNDGLELYSVGVDGRIRRFMSDAMSDPCVATAHFGKLKGSHGNYCMDLSSDTSPPVVFIPSGSFIYVCDMDKCCVIRKLSGHFKQVNCFKYDPIYQEGYSGGNDAAVMTWNGNLTMEKTYQEEHKVSISSRHETHQLISLDDDDE